MATITQGLVIGSGETHNVTADMIAYDTLINVNKNPQYAKQIVLNGGSAVRTNVLGGRLFISNGGYAESAVINGEDAQMTISASGSAYKTSVKNGGILYVSAGGSAVDVNIANNAEMILNVDSKTYITGTSHGKTIKVGDNVISNITIHSGCSMLVANGWKSYDTLINVNKNPQYAKQIVLNGGSAVRTNVLAGRLFISNGGYAESAVIDGEDAQMTISASGSAYKTSVKNGGILYVSAGGSAVDVNIANDAEMILNVDSKTYITGTSHGKTVKVGNNVISNITIYSGCSMLVANGWKSYDTFINVNHNPQYAKQIVLDGGSAVRTNVLGGRLFISNGGYAESAVISGSKAEMTISSYGVAENTTVKNGGKLYIAKNGEHRGSMTIAAGCQVTVSAGGIVDFTVENQKTSDGYLINNLSLVSGTPTYTITVKNDQANGTYKLAQSASSLSGSITIGDGTVDYGTIAVNGADFVHNGITYSLDNVSGNLTLTVSGSTNLVVEGDLDANGLADIILVHTKQGYSGAWLTTGDNASIIKWGSLSDVKAGTEILGTGKLYGSADDGQDIFFTDGKSVGAWNVVDGKVTSYKTIMNVNATTNVLGLGDFNGDGATDLLLRSTSGDLGFYATDGSGWDYLIGLGTDWTIEAIGDLNGDGMDDTVVRHDAGFAGTFLTQADGTVKWKNLDTLSDDMTIIGTGDFNEDGVDDVLLQNKSNGWVGAWLVEDGSVAGFMGICKNKNTIEQIADFNGDGIDDLRVRAGADIGVLYVNGADDTTWQYFKSVGTEWDTSTSLLA